MGVTQDEYADLPARVSPEGVVYTEWELNEDELQKLICGARLRILIHTFRTPLQPIRVDVLDPIDSAEES